MSAVTLERDAIAVPRTDRDSARGWLLGPWLDTLFLANVAWPLVLLAPVGEGFVGHTGLAFWQVYFITTPHRWITLPLVFLDRERFRARRRAFLGVAAVIGALCLGVRATTGTLTCLLAIDYVWNAWHFASQHHGVYRIYGRLSEPERVAGLRLEKVLLRAFLLYVILRVAGATWSHATLEEWLRRCDWAVAVVPLGLIAWDALRVGLPADAWRNGDHRNGTGRASGTLAEGGIGTASGARDGGPGAWVGRMTYLISVSAMYLALLWAVHARQPALVLSLATASALFHAIEYLTLVGWSVQQRSAAAGDRMGLLGYLAPRWGLTLGVFLVVLGGGGWLMDQHLLETWLLVNAIVAFLHYAYDGMIWRRPAAQPRMSS